MGLHLRRARISMLVDVSRTAFSSCRARRPRGAPIPQAEAEAHGYTFHHLLDRSGTQNPNGRAVVKS